jgi:branched-chain amino acid transport system substrate-binding protein
MRLRVGRRKLLGGSAAAALVANLPMPALAQAKPIKIGLLTVKTGPLAQGGIQMEQGTRLFLKDSGDKLSGRATELVVADTGGNPAGAKTKAQELIERDNVDMIFGPLAAFELLAISDYVASKKVPILSLAAAEDMTQRKPNPYFVRASATAAQAMQPLGDYAAKELKYKTAMTIVEDFAFGYEQMGGFQRVFEDAGGRVKAKLWPPIVTPDYTPYLAQLGGVDVIVQGFAGSNPLKFMKQYKDAGLTLPVIGGETAGDDALLKSFGDEAIGMISASPYTADLDTPSNQKFVAGMLRDYENLPGLYAAGLYINGWWPMLRCGNRRQGRRQGRADQSAPPGGVDRYAARPVPFRPFRQCSATSSFADASGKAASWSIRRSRPTPTLASSGPTTRNGFSSSRSIPAITRH